MFEPLTVEPPAVQDVTGKYGGTLTWAEQGTEIDTFHPLVSSSATSSELRTMVFDPLVAYDNHLWKHRPALAWKWDHSEDGRAWTFHLRKGVKWSDGQPFTSRDVVFTFGTVFDPRIPNSDVDGFRVGDAPLPACEAVDDHTVRFTLHAVDALFLVHIGSVVISPAHLWEDTMTGDKPTYPEAMGTDLEGPIVGTGPFRIVEYKAAERIVYERNPYSWKQDRAGNRLPYVERAIVQFVKDASTRSYQFLDGNQDTITDIPVPDYDQFKAKEEQGAFTLHRLGLSLNVNWICFNQHPGKDPASGEPFVAAHKLRWFQDRRFRRAMSHAVDREGLVKLFLGGKGAPIYGQTSPSNKSWYADHTKFEYDPARAAALLDEMGLADRDGDGVREDAEGHRVSVELSSNVDNDLRIKILAQLKADWAKVGVEGVMRPLNFNELVSQLEDGHRWECILLGWGSGVPPDPLNGKNIHLSSGRLHVWYPKQETPANEWEAENDRLIAAMDREPEEEARKALWAKYVEHEAQEQPIIYLFASNAYAATKKRLMNVKASVLRPQTWWNVEELWLAEPR